jgi:hypothetical protein
VKVYRGMETFPCIINIGTWRRVVNVKLQPGNEVLVPTEEDHGRIILK